MATRRRRGGGRGWRHADGDPLRTGSRMSRSPVGTPRPTGGDARDTTAATHNADALEQLMTRKRRLNSRRLPGMESATGPNRKRNVALACRSARPADGDARDGGATEIAGPREQARFQAVAGNGVGDTGPDRKWNVALACRSAQTD